MPVDLKELRRLHEAATPRPWQSERAYDGRRSVCILRSISTTLCVNSEGDAWHEHPEENFQQNAALIAAARNALPSLLDEIERLREENARLKVGLCRIRDEADFYSDAIVYSHAFQRVQEIAREALGK
jgi:hypothetical protein